MKNYIFAVAVFCLLGACATSPRSNVEPLPTTFAEVAERTMDDAIATVRKTHFSEDLGEDAWLKIREKFAPAILKTRRTDELVSAINAMLSELGHSHVTLLPPEDKDILARYAAMSAGKPLPELAPKTDIGELEIPEDEGVPKNPPGDVGLLLAYAGGEVRVSDVMPKSPAERAGIKPGDKLLRIGTGKDQFASLGMSGFPWGMIAQMQLPGESGSMCVVKTLPVGSDTPRTYRLIRQPDGLKWVKLGVMPVSSGYLLAKLDTDKIGYITFSPCMPEQIFRTRMIIRQFAAEGMKGLILDVRNNPGGLGEMAAAVCGMLTDTPMPIVEMRGREMVRISRAYPQKGAFLGPVALLINSTSASSSEILAAALQDNRRAHVFGEKTAGMCLGSCFIELSTGFRLQTVFFDVKRIKGGDIEGVGVSPDEKVRVQSDDLLKGRDTVIERAKKYLHKEIAA